MKKFSHLIPIIFLIVSCDSKFEIKVGDDETVNQICLTDIYGGGEKYWDISYVEKDCRKGEILTANVVLWEEKTLSDLKDYEHRLNYLTSKICDYDKQILIREIPQKLPGRSDFLYSYDLSCVYSGGFDFPGSKWIEEMSNEEQSK
jgi:hypothetical protein